MVEVVESAAFTWMFLRGIFWSIISNFSFFSLRLAESAFFCLSLARFRTRIICVAIGSLSSMDDSSSFILLPEFASAISDRSLFTSSTMCVLCRNPVMSRRFVGWSISCCIRWRRDVVSVVEAPEPMRFFFFLFSFCVWLESVGSNGSRGERFLR